MLSLLSLPAAFIGLTGDMAFTGMVNSFSDFPADFKRVKDFF